jgi:hypothetical protein
VKPAVHLRLVPKRRLCGALLPPPHAFYGLMFNGSCDSFACPLTVSVLEDVEAVINSTRTMSVLSVCEVPDLNLR